MAWLPGQDAYLRSQDRFRLYRGGNQSIGKTTVGLSDLLWHAEGRHPFRNYGQNEPGEYWICCASWSQSLAIQTKLWDLLDKASIHENTKYRKDTGFSGKPPTILVRHKPTGGYSVIRFKTTGQDTLDLAGASIKGALFDEPPHDESTYSEVAKRVQASNGWVSITMTPVGAPVDWIRDRAAKGKIQDIHVRLTPAALIPVGETEPIRLKDGTPCDARWIEQIIAETPEHEVPVRIHGEWEMRITDRYFTKFRSSGADGHVRDDVPEGEVELLLGIDYGTKPGKQIVLLVGVEEQEGWPRVWVFDEYTDPTGSATVEDDAEGVLAMLDRNDLRWADLAMAHGDRVHMPGSAQQKSNKDLMGQLSRLLRVPQQDLVPQIRTVKRGQDRGAGSVSTGARWLWYQTVRNNLIINPRCRRLIDAMDRWNMADDDWKDPIDALRYALDPLIFKRRNYERRDLHVR
jgi:hypothetical protein